MENNCRAESGKQKAKSKVKVNTTCMGVLHNFTVWGYAAFAILKKKEIKKQKTGFDNLKNIKNNKFVECKNEIFHAKENGN